MPKENQTDSRRGFAPRFLPWLLGGAMLLVFLLTLNPWITMLNLGQVAQISGWSWQPQLFNPLIFLISLPFRLLSGAHLPIALNVLSAICAAATLAVLARSVAILPHDRTEMERVRERSDFSFLTGWGAWIPPTVAVFFGGLQLAFWEHATSFSGESFELLWFAVIVWQLLEYRLDEHEGRLFVAAALYGAGMAENWAMVPLFPLFLAAVIWLRKLDFFNLTFLFRMLFCGLGGMLLYLLLPLVTAAEHYPLSFWQALRFHLRSDLMIVRALKTPLIRHDLALMSLTTLVPTLIMSFRWSASFGDSSRLGSMLVNYFFHVVNAVIFGTLVWVMFDPPFSARQLATEMGVNAPALALHYLTTLCLGYYCGYFLVVFGKQPTPGRRGGSRPEPALPKAFVWLCPVIVAGTLAAIVAAGGFLIYKNAPIIRAFNDRTLQNYAQFATRNLPANGAIILSDQPVQTLLVQAALAREGRAAKYPVLDTQSLNFPTYHEYLHKKFPQIWPLTITTNETAIGTVAPLHIFLQLSQLSSNISLCYLNPSFGYYFEQFYEEPHGLVYTMKRLPEDTLLPPSLETNLIAENGAFWKELLDRSQPAIAKALNPPNYKKRRDAVGWVMMHLHSAPEPNPNALFAGTIYSRSLNFLGVQAQRAGALGPAADFFSEAQELNPDNVAANINLAFNKNLRAGLAKDVEATRITPDQFGKYHNWNEVLNACGPFDETSFCFENGVWLMQGGLMRQALASFNRVRQLVPDNLAARLFVAQIYVFARQPDLALEALKAPLAHPKDFSLTEFNSTELNILAASVHFLKNENAAAADLLEKEIARHPDDETLLTSATQSLFMRGLYTNALHVINRKLDRVPNDPQWLFGKGFASLQIHAYDDAIAAFSHILEIQTNNPDALYNRAFAYYQSDHLNEARADFRQLQTTFTNAFQVAYGLGEIAWKQHDTNEAVRNYQIYLANAPTNSAELKTIRERVDSVKGDK